MEDTHIVASYTRSWMFLLESKRDMPSRLCFNGKIVIYRMESIFRTTEAVKL